MAILLLIITSTIFFFFFTSYESSTTKPFYSIFFQLTLKIQKKETFFFSLFIFSTFHDFFLFFNGRDMLIDKLDERYEYVQKCVCKISVSFIVLFSVNAFSPWIDQNYLYNLIIKFYLTKFCLYSYLENSRHLEINKTQFFTTSCMSN